MTNNLISINEASSYLNLENTGDHLNASSNASLNTSTSNPDMEPNKLFNDDGQGHPNMEL